MTAPLTSAQRQRLRSPANLWRALIPLLVLIALLVVFTWPRGTRSDGVHVVDVTAPLAAARQEAGFTLVAPTGLSSQWRSTSTEFEPAGPSSGATFRIGYVSPAGRYAEVLQGDDQAEAVSAPYGALTADGTVAVNAASWQLFKTSDNHPLLRHTVGKATVIVTGTADQAELLQLASSLR